MNLTKLQAQAARPVAAKIIEELRAQTVDLLEKRAEAWILDNKLVHAGAARQLAAELRQKFVNDAK
jgi:hypothetical protein